MEIEALGWDSFFDDRFAAFRAQGLVPARVVRESRHLYDVECGRGTIQAQASGRFLYASDSRADFPTVGDWVACRDGGDVFLIEGLLPRKSRFSRKSAGETTEEQIVAANIDFLCVVCGLDGGRNFNLRGLERYLSTAREGGAAPVVVLNKCDLCADRDESLAAAQSVAGGAPVRMVSALTGDGIGGLLSLFPKGSTIAFTGPSGVGKSALVNALLGDEHMRTGRQREDDLRGRHTTTHKELVRLSCGVMLIDTPGMRELQLWGSGEGLDSSFSEITEAAMNCRFGDCTHQGEPGCAVQKLLVDGVIDAARYANYLDMRREIAYLESRVSEKGQRDRKKKEKDLSRLVKLYHRDFDR